jgi:xylan 1,4-beta-xylosidase
MTENGAARQYVRIYNQPETAVRVGTDGRITYEWNRFDEMAEMILSTGCKLKVMFFGMPSVLAAHPEKVLKRSNGSNVCTSPPNDYKQWEALCADFTRHVVAKYGLAEVKRWTFRCWNEPDLSGFWYQGDVSEYLKLYDHFAKGVKDVCPEIRVGGPALSSTKTYSDPKAFKRFLEHVVRGRNHATGGVGAPLDFLGVHTYGGSGGGGGPGRTYPDVAYMIEQQLRYADLRDAYPELKSVPIHVEEWGVTSGGTKGVKERPTADVRNSEYGSAFLVDWVARHVRMRQENGRHFESFTFCASGYEKAPAQDFMGYRTLDTKSGFHKPILNAYKLLNKLAPELVLVKVASLEGPVSAFATRGSDRIAVLIVNYQHDQLDGRGASYPVALTVVSPWGPDVAMTLQHWRIDKTRSNAYTAYKEAGSPANPTPAQIAEVKGRMGLELLEPARQMTLADWDGLTFEMPCNAVSLIELVRRQE